MGEVVVPWGDIDNFISGLGIWADSLILPAMLLLALAWLDLLR